MDQNVRVPDAITPSTPAGALSESKHALLCATERLYVEVGPSVSLREIAQAAGQRNNSAVNYHFGSREGVETAVLTVRTTQMEQVRAARLAALPADADLESLMRVILEPLLVTPYEQGSTHYARFAEVVRSFPSMAGALGDRDLWHVSRRVSGRIVRLVDLPREQAWRRMEAMTTALFSLAADRERAQFDGGFAFSSDELVRMLVGMVTG